MASVGSCRINVHWHPFKKMPFHNNTNRGNRNYVQIQKKISGQYIVCARMHVKNYDEAEFSWRRFDQQSESRRFSIVPTCLRAGTILARASRLPSSLWSNVQSCCSGRRWSRQKTDPNTHTVQKTGLNTAQKSINQSIYLFSKKVLKGLLQVVKIVLTNILRTRAHFCEWSAVVPRSCGRINNWSCEL